MGIKKQPGPYRMNEDHLLPRFQSPPRTVAVTVGDELPTPSHPVTAQPEPEQEPGVGGATVGTNVKRQSTKARPPRIRRLFAWLSTTWSGNRRIAQAYPASAKQGKQPVQAEFALNTVRVVRNDLSDCGNGVPGTLNGAAGSDVVGRRPVGIVWNQLSARLLRQAVIDFNLVQKERGKLLH